MTPEYVNTATGLELHQFKWLDDEKEIGNLPLNWNWLVGEYPYNPDIKLAHFTLGGPYFEKFVDANFQMIGGKFYLKLLLHLTRLKY